MLVPELLDIAEHLDIADASKLDKQGLIYRILDKQALTPAATNGAEKPKRKRTVKTSTGNTTEEAEVMTEAPAKKEKHSKETKTVSKDKNTKEERPKRARIKLKTAGDTGNENEDTQEEDVTTETSADDYAADESLTQMGANLLSMLGDDEPIIYPDEADIAEPVAPTKQLGSRKEPAFNVEFDGIIQAEGVLEMMPD